MKNCILHIASYLLFLVSYTCYAQNQTDAAGLKQGYWEKQDDNRKIMYKGTFKNNMPQGVFYYYYKNSDILHTKTEFKQDGKIAYATMYNLNGKIQAQGKYIGEEKDSTWNFYDGKGVLISSENYINGKKNGTSKVFYENGIVSEEKNYKNNVEEGAFKLYYDDKKIKGEGSYISGQYNGKCSWYYPNKIAAAQGIYENGIKKGVWIYNSSDGKKPEREVWQNGKKLSEKETEAYLKNKQAETKTNTAPKK